MPNRSGLILALAIMAVSGYAAIGAWGWPLKTALFPLGISVPLFILATIEAAWLWLAPRGERAASLEHASAEVPEPLARQRTLRTFAWILGFFAATLLFGFPVAVPLFVFLYLKIEARESWLFAIVFTAGVWACFYGLLDRMLHLPFESGWLF